MTTTPEPKSWRYVVTVKGEKRESPRFPDFAFAQFRAVVCRDTFAALMVECIVCVMPSDMPPEFVFYSPTTSPT